MIHKESETSTLTTKTTHSRSGKEKKQAKKEMKSSHKQGWDSDLQFMNTDEVCKD